jgi:sugar porter (SP) family MFS transporter
MSIPDVGLVNGIFAVGGCMSSAVAGIMADKFGRRRTAFASALAFIIGSYVSASAFTVTSLSVGRFISGLAAGSALVVTPIYLSEISPEPLRGQFGSLSQIAVNVGILITQVLGLFWSSTTDWRRILYAGAILGVVNGILLPFGVESPKWLLLNGMAEEATVALKAIRGPKHDIQDELAQWRLDRAGTTEEDSGLLSTLPETAQPTSKPVGLVEYTTLKEYRLSLTAAVGIMVIQQTGGINAIVFYGVTILGPIMPDYSRLVNVLISAINLAVTTAVSPLVDRKGRRPLLLASIAGMSLFSATLALAANSDRPVLSALSAILFVISFALGLGPIPFLLVSELTPSPAVGVAQSFSTTFNWIATFLVGYLFPILQEQLGSNVFFVFTFTSLLAFWFVKAVIPETKHSR